MYAVNGAGLSSTVTTSGPIRPAYRPLGQAGNVLQVAFATTGYDASGNPTTGWQPDQVAALSSFFNKMYPFLLQLYGPPADSYTVTVVRDLRYHSSNIFIPATDEIRMDDGFYPQLFTHELAARVPQRPHPVERSELELRRHALGLRREVRASRELRGDEPVRAGVSQ